MKISTPNQQHEAAAMPAACFACFFFFLGGKLRPSDQAVRCNLRGNTVTSGMAIMTTPVGPETQ